jgi:hypothetical protein
MRDVFTSVSLMVVVALVVMMISFKG